MELADEFLFDSLQVPCFEMLNSLTASYLPRAFICTVAVIQLVRGQPLVQCTTWPDLAQWVVIRLGTVWASCWPLRKEDMQPSRQDTPRGHLFAMG